MIVYVSRLSCDDPSCPAKIEAFDSKSVLAIARAASWAIGVSVGGSKRVLDYCPIHSPDPTPAHDPGLARQRAIPKATA